jgi:hypothetical protein
VKIFCYYRDGLFVLCCLLYAVNRWVVSPHAHSAFLRGHFNDLLLIPCALPLRGHRPARHPQGDR